MKYFEHMEKELGERNVMENVHLGNRTTCDFGNAVVMNAVAAINKIQSLNGARTIDVWEATKGALQGDIFRSDEQKSVNTLEEFVDLTNELADFDYANIMKKFKSVISGLDNISDNATSKTSIVKLNEIKDSFDKNISIFIDVTSDLDKMHLTCAGYNVFNLPVDEINDAVHYAKDAIINLIKDTSRDIWDIIVGKNQKNLAPKLTKPEAFTTQQQVFTPVPDYTNNKEIMKHFVIGNNVVIYDPRVQQSFEKDLLSLSKELDKVDKELSLEEPSKFGFEEFISPLNFKAVRLNKSGDYIDRSDADNYVAIWTDKSMLYITKPSKATA